MKFNAKFEDGSDQDILQALDESNMEWVNAWKEAVAKADSMRKTP